MKPLPVLNLLTLKNIPHAETDRRKNWTTIQLMGEKNIPSLVLLPVIFLAFIIKISPLLKKKTQRDVDHKVKLSKTSSGTVFWFVIFGIVRK
jgi:hypothetical protein